MDFDSSAKFISSLAKFLQSLCNGYMEFSSGVEVIGHIYINIDTGKKIDYILNEKVCKTNENSVTFISNSFHAQPAEKPKPPEKPIKYDKTAAEGNYSTSSPSEDGIFILDSEPNSDNIETLPQHQQHRPRPNKRPHSQQNYAPSNQNQQVKLGRHDHGFINTESSLNSNSPKLSENNFLTSHTQEAEPFRENVNFASMSFIPNQPSDIPQTSHDPSQFQQEVQPTIEIDMDHGVTVKQEYDTSHQYDSAYGEFEESQAAHSGTKYEEYYHEAQGIQEFSQGGSLNANYFNQGGGTSQEGQSDGGAQLYGSDFSPTTLSNLKSSGFDCSECNRSFKQRLHLEEHYNGVHLGKKQYACDFCDKRFVYKRGKNAHMVLAHGTNLKGRQIMS